MLAPSSPIELGVQAVLLGGAQILFGYLLADLVLGERERDRVLPWALALPAATAWVLTLQLLHWVSGGNVWPHELLVRAATGALIVGAIVVKVLRRRRKRVSSAPLGARLAMLGAAVLAVVLWSYPVFKLVPLGWKGDMNLHLGWAGQLLNGEPTPSILVTGDATNTYPWLFHAMLAWFSEFAPGGTPLDALGPLQISIPVGMTLTLFGLGNVLCRRWEGGAAAALFGALSGGFGYFVAHGPAAVESPRDQGAALTYYGDMLLKRSYNIAFHNASPPFPRDLAYCLTAAFLLLLMVGLVRGRPAFLVAAGLALGSIGLTGGETFIVAFGVAVVVCLASGNVLRTAGYVLVPALALWSLWIGPILAAYSESDGFLNTAAAPVDLPLYAVLFAWGLATPLAAFGIFRLAPSIRDPRVKVALSQLCVAGVVVLSVGLIPRLFGEGFTTLGREHRYWPLLHLGIVLFAAAGAVHLLDVLRRRSGVLAAAAAVFVVLLAIPSPLLASIEAPNVQPHNELLRDAMLHGDTVVGGLAEEGRAECVVAVPASRSREALAYTGYRLVHLTAAGGLRQPGVRWRHVPDQIPNARRRADNAVLTGARPAPDDWQRLVDSYSVDLVAVPAEDAARPEFAPYPRRTVTSPTGSFVIVETADCD